MYCVLCGGNTSVQLIKTDYEFRGERYWLIDVPAEVCETCQEPYFEMAVHDEMHREAFRQWARKHAIGS